MKKQNEDEKPQGAESAWFNGKKVSRKNTTTSQGARNQTLLANFSKVLDSVWGCTDQKCTRRQYTWWFYTPVCNSKTDPTQQYAY